MMTVNKAQPVAVRNVHLAPTLVFPSKAGFGFTSKEGEVGRMVAFY